MAAQSGHVVASVFLETKPLWSHSRTNTAAATRKLPRGAQAWNAVVKRDAAADHGNPTHAQSSLCYVDTVVLL